MEHAQNLPQSLPELQRIMKKCRACLEEGYEIYPPAVPKNLNDNGCRNTAYNQAHF